VPGFSLVASTSAGSVGPCGELPMLLLVLSVQVIVDWEAPAASEVA
jgi:hypothetical protein